MQLVVYTDGSCFNNRVGCGAGGWAYCIINEHDDIIKHSSGSQDKTTNNRMEMLAVLEAFKYIKDNFGYNHDITVYSDNMIVVYGINKRKKKSHQKNLDLWYKIYDIMFNFKSCYSKWVKGHSGNYYNELCDELAENESFNLYNKVDYSWISFEQDEQERQFNHLRGML